MAYSLSGERLTVAAVTVNPVAGILAWFAELRARRVQRVALSTLLELDPALLDDLGIDRVDVVEAMHSAPRSAGEVLARRRAARSRNWRRHQ